LGGQLIAQIRNAISERASRDLTILDSSDQFLHDLSTHPSNFINMFLYDGGKTVRQICSKSEVLQYLQQTASLQIKFLYVDTDFKPFVSETDEFRQIPELEQIDERLYAPLYEALIRKSGMVHNESPKGHKFDVNRSVRALRELSRKFGFKLEVKKTSQLPFYRTVLTRQYAYYTQLLPTFSEAAQDEGAPEYYSLRISAKSPVGLALSKHYDRLWDNASAHIE